MLGNLNLNLFNSTYNKGIMMALTVIIVVGNQMLGTDLGIGVQGQHWISLVVGAAGTLLTIASGNKNQPTLALDHVVVNKSDVKEGANIIVAHKP